MHDTRGHKQSVDDIYGVFPINEEPEEELLPKTE